MKIIDIDSLSEKYIRKYLQDNKGKYTADELEEMLPEIYEEFGAKELSELGGVSPKEYYSTKRNELIEIFIAHVESCLTVDEYLTRELVSFGSEDELIALLTNDKSDELLNSVIAILNLKQSKKAFNRFIDLLLDNNICSCVKNNIVETLTDNADEIIDSLLEKVSNDDSAMEYVCEILSAANKRDERITALISKGLLTRNRIPEYCSYVVKYYDDSALDALYEAVSRDNISYVDFKELKLAIEALGGECDDKRDFSADKTYKKIKEVENADSKDD